MTLSLFFVRACAWYPKSLRLNSYQLFQGASAVLIVLGWIWIYQSEGYNAAVVSLGVLGLSAIGMGAISFYEHHKERQEERDGLKMAEHLSTHLPSLIKGGSFYILNKVGRILSTEEDALLRQNPTLARKKVSSIYSILGEHDFSSEQVYPFAMALMGSEFYETTFYGNKDQIFQGTLIPLGDDQCLFCLKEQIYETAPSLATPYVLSDTLHQTLTALEEERNKPLIAISSQAFAHLPLGLVAIDEQGIIREANPSFITLVKNTHLIGLSLYSLLQEGDHGILRQWLKGKKPSDEACMMGLLEPSARHVEVTFSPLGEGDETRFLLSFVNQTEQKNLELQFAQSQKMQAVGQLAGGIAHDFNNLLTAMSGFCDLLLLRHEAGDPSFSDIMQIRQNANRAASLVKQLLAFSRQQTLLPKVLSINDLLQDIRHLLVRLLGERVALSFYTSPDIWPVKVDQSQFDQVIMNLSVNARDAMLLQGGGTLTIRTRNVLASEVPSLNYPVLVHQDYIEISIQDTGTGIPPEVTGKIFEPFFTTKEVGKGTGLGLSTVYGIVKQTGGFIFVQSTMGEGTLFSIYLPRYQESLSEAFSRKEQSEKTIEQTTDLSGKETIVLVEDESAVRNFAVRALQTRGYCVLEAETGEEALEIIKTSERPIDLLISDVVMPEMDGPTLVAQVRALYPDLKVIFMSGYAEEAFKKNLKKDEVFHFLPKPFSLKFLVETVRGILSEEKNENK
jgi:signal transduction histidine kinase/ActR/RegA family two-component response regulator